MTPIPRSFAVGRLKYYRNIFKYLGNGYLVFFFNDILVREYLLSLQDRSKDRRGQSF